MASSSVSQESLDMDDFDTSARRNRIRVHRGHGARGSLPHRGLPGDRGDAGEHVEGRPGEHHNGDGGDGHLPGDHESPTRGAAARLKDKRSRANHMKGKLPKDKRKLREKRRSTGVVHCMPSTESTGDSLDDDDDDEEETKKNTTYNESTTSSHHHQTLYEARHAVNSYSPRRNKSPSDLEADLEDNQDYDSTVSHSETNLTLIGRSEPTDARPSIGLRASPRVRGPGSKYSPETSRAFKFSTNNMSSDADSSSHTNTPSTSSSSSILSRYRELEQTTGGSPATEPDSPGRYNNNNSSETRSWGSLQTRAGTSLASATKPPLGEAPNPRPAPFSALRDSGSTTVGARGDKPVYPSSLSSSTRFRDREVTPGSVHSRLVGYQSPRPFTTSSTFSSSSAAASAQQSESISQLEKQLEKEREENKKLQSQLEEKDKKIAELERALELLNNECDGLDEDNLKLQEENKALIRAMSKLTTNV